MATADQKNGLTRTVAIMSGLGSFVMAIVAIIGVVVYQTNSNTQLHTEVKYVRTEITTIKEEIRNNRNESKDEMSKRLKEQDDKISTLQSEVNGLKVKVSILESKSRN